MCPRWTRVGNGVGDRIGVRVSVRIRLKVDFVEVQPGPLDSVLFTLGQANKNFGSPYTWYL